MTVNPIDFFEYIRLKLKMKKTVSDIFTIWIDIPNIIFHNKTKNKKAKNIFNVEKAKEIALQLAPGSVITDLELDYEHGKAVYEGEMRKGFMEYEFEIDAITGDVLKFSSDYDD